MSEATQPGLSTEQVNLNSSGTGLSIEFLAPSSLSFDRFVTPEKSSYE